jgi:UDP-2,3-diacylglucosamine pyrophosphatase LpxH
MLVFVSDLHLTDESFPPAVPVNRLTEAVDGILQRGKVGGMTSATLVLLGDIFEIIKSPHWLTDHVRPRESVTEAHRKTVTKIYMSIVKANEPFFKWLETLPARFPFVTLGEREKRAVT